MTTEHIIIMCVLAVLIPLVLLRVIGWALGIADLRQKLDEILTQLKIQNQRNNPP